MIPSPDLESVFRPETREVPAVETFVSDTEEGAKRQAAACSKREPNRAFRSKAIFDGLIDAVRIHNRAVTRNEVESGLHSAPEQTAKAVSQDDR